jgi:hypothetical protein
MHKSNKIKRNRPEKIPSSLEAAIDRSVQAAVSVRIDHAEDQIADRVLAKLRPAEPARMSSDSYSVKKMYNPLAGP